MRLLDELEEFYGERDARNLYERRKVTVKLHPGENELPSQRNLIGVDKVAWTYFCVGDMKKYLPVELNGTSCPNGEGHICWKSYVMDHGLSTAGGEWAEGKYMEMMPDP